jgi:sporulation protein YlmC with PRC-barrel domain
MQRTAGICLALVTIFTYGTTNSLAQAPSQENDLRQVRGLSAAELIGAPVRSADGNEVGEIQDLLLSSDGQVVTAVVSVGGFLDIADRLVAVPYSDVRLWSDTRTLAIPLTSAELETEPAYKSGPPAVGESHPIVDPAQTAPPNASIRREAEAEASRVFAGDDPRVSDGIAENKKAYEDEEENSQREAE